MKVIVLTAVQQTQAAALKTELEAAQLAQQTARTAYQVFLNSAAGFTSAQALQRVLLTDDGTTLVIN